MTTPRRRRAFTLLEVVIASGILSVLILGMMSLLTSTQQATLTTAAAIDLDGELRGCIRLLRRELRQSGWEVKDFNIDQRWDGNQVAAPVPTDFDNTAQPDPVFAFGTPLQSVSNEVIFRRRVGFDLETGTNPALEDWTNNIETVSPATQYKWIRFAREVDIDLGPYRNLPGAATQTRYRLVRQELLLNPGVTPVGATGWVNVGAAFKNLEDVRFYRENYDTILVTLEFLFPQPVWRGSTPPEPIRRKVTDRIQLLNGSLNGV